MLFSRFMEEATEKVWTKDERMVKVLNHIHGNIYENVMPDNDIVLEIKYDSYIPSRILHLLTDISTVQESVSKYIICSDRLRERLY